MAELPVLSDKQGHVLSLIAKSGDVLLFDLEVQELSQLGLVDDHHGVLSLTELGVAALRDLVGPSSP